MLTTRMADHGHPDYLVSGTNTHHMLQLKGLGEEDALNYFQSLMKLPPAPKFALPERKSLLELFALVDFHPLSIGLLAQQLKVRRLAELGQRLEELLDAQPENIHDKSLRASLELSLDRLPPEARKWLPRLGVFQGGAIESELLAITEFSEEEWRLLRPALEQAGLIQAEALSGGRTFLKFHPTLAPALWGRLTPQEQTELRARHRERYYQLSGYLYHEDTRNPHQVRAIVLRELSNLLAAVRGALQAEEENAVAFVNNVNKFLNYFGLRQDLKTLNEAARQLTVESGSHNWFLSRSNQGEQLYNAGRYSEAAQIFEEILAGLGAELSYEHCVTLNRLGRCFHFQGQAPQAAEYFRRGIAVAGQLEQSDGVKRQSGALQVDLADALRDMGDYAGAREAYQASSTIAKEINELRMEAVANGQLGTLAMLEGNLQEAEKRYQEALRSFQALNETASEAAAWHQLGMLYRRAKDWEAAERAYRESAALEEGLGNLAGAAATWNNLAAVTQLAGKPQEAEGWYRKALEVFKEQGDLKNIAVDLNNLADLLQGDSRPHIHEGKSLRENDKKRLDEAQQMAEEALAISQTLDPGAAAIWTTYNILAEIADQQDDPQQARGYRRQARQTKFAFKGTEHELKQHAELIGAVVATAKDNEIRTQLEPALENLVKNGWGSLVAALRRVLDGGRDEDELCESSQLDREDSMIVMAILRELRG
ncbi:MAG: tetratricopeptide repeat protein [bacterium]|nr:tetratricopeptide repeat protein [bacterium]